MQQQKQPQIRAAFCVRCCSPLVTHLYFTTFFIKCQAVLRSFFGGHHGDPPPFIPIFIPVFCVKSCFLRRYVSGNCRFSNVSIIALCKPTLCTPLLTSIFTLSIGCVILLPSVHSSPILSTHAPARGATPPPCPALASAAFQLTRPRGARLSPFIAPPYKFANFNSRACEGRDQV